MQGESYRLYVGNDLLTERTFSWDPATTYVEEHIIINGDSGIMPAVTVSSVRGHNCFDIRNMSAINTQ